VVAESFSRLFQRNALNIGFPVLICPGVTSFADEGQTVEVHFDSGQVRNLTTATEIVGEPYPADSPPGQLLRLGGLRPFLESWLDEHPEVRAASH
jgi:3-isopropylmalate/(R)-2-methylmalate dehydratase small subunit